MYSGKRRFRLFRDPAFTGGGIPSFDRDTFTWGAAVSTGTFTFLNFCGSTNGSILYGWDSSTGRLRKSINGGSSWTDLVSASTLSSLDCSADGSKIIITQASGIARFSVNGGTSWTFRQLGTTRVPVSGAVSDDGTKFILAYTNTTDGIQTSPDTVTWTKVSSINDATITDMDCSADNSICYIVGDTTLYKSTDSGATWQSIALTLPTINSGTDNRYTLLRCSSNGGVVVVASREAVTSPTKNIQVSIDGGLTWDQHTLGFYTSSAIWNISCSSDGSVIAVGMTQGEVYTSTDGGETFDYEYIPNLAVASLLTSTTQAFKDNSALLVYSGGNLHTAAITSVVPPPSPNPTPPTAPAKTVVWTANVNDPDYAGYDVVDICGDLTATTLYFADPNNGVLTSTNGGSTVSVAFSEFVLFNVECSQDATKVVAYYLSGAATSMYTSTTSGSVGDWVLTDLGASIGSAIVTPDGSTFIATGVQTVYTSPDGVTWTTIPATTLPAGVQVEVASSNTGSILYAFARSTTVYISTNGGTTWVSLPLSISASIATIFDPLPNTFVDCSLDGSVFIVGSTALTNNVQVFTYGGRSSKTFTIGTSGVIGVRCSNSGNVLTVTTLDGQVFVSDDIGQTFDLQTIPSFDNPNGIIPTAYLAKNESKAFLYVMQPNYYTATIT